MRRAPVALLVLVLSACSGREVPRDTIDLAHAIAAEVDQGLLWQDIEQLAELHAGDEPVRCVSLEPETDPTCHLTNAKTRGFVVARFQVLGLAVDLDANETAPATTNVLAEVTGTVHPGEVIQIGAHFDAFFRGADDNTSGLAVVLEVARLLARRPMNRTVRFVGYDLEEFGLVGSQRLIASRTLPKVALVLDGVAFTDSRPGSQRSLPGFPSPSRADFLAVISNDASRTSVEALLQTTSGEAVPPIFSITAPGLGAGPVTGNLMRSDHSPLWLANANAVFFSDTSNFRNPNYHLPSDTPETLDMPFLAGVARLSVMSIVTWANQP